MDMKDKVAIVTGAGSGIGRALAQRIAQAGARAVVCTDLNAANAAETAQMIGDVASAAALDVAEEAAIERLVVETEAQHGAVDVFVSNAGYGRAGGLNLPTAEWQTMMNVHTFSHLAAARAVIPGMIKRGGGYLLSTASAAGLLTQIDSGPYAVSKHAAVALAEWIAINYADQGIGVSVLCPQAVRTNILGPRAANASSNTRQAAGDGILEPEFVADACLDAMREGRFLVLPHPEVATYFQRKANDYDRWLSGMRRFRRKLLG
ncbi:MAG: SDR family oxidoreductase [Gammaproteobacteria bacterium]|nr:SDR family oxidoreductase [Gammaproteobacteria bacterium]